MKKIAFIFKEGRVLRLKQKSKFPTEFFYGYIELKRKFNNLDLLEDKDIGMSPPLSFITKKLYLATISKYEQNFLEKQFNKSIHYFPFGIDVNFWKPSIKNETNEKFILSIGNDSHRDWETLIKAWSSKFPNLKIITNHKIKTKKKNIKILNSNWNTKKISDQEILKFYNLCDFVIIPLKNTIQPSGQSVCLQAMACNKIVVMSKID